jgi:hypothetical protein
MKARQKGMGTLALKGMAKTIWPKAMKESKRPNPKCWYQPAALPEEASLGLRWTLSKPITAAIPPGDEKYSSVAMDVAQRGGAATKIVARASRRRYKKLAKKTRNYELAMQSLRP